jgi:hypothetical protein
MAFSRGSRAGGCERSEYRFEARQQRGFLRSPDDAEVEDPFAGMIGRRPQLRIWSTLTSVAVESHECAHADPWLQFARSSSHRPAV